MPITLQRICAACPVYRMIAHACMLFVLQRAIAAQTCTIWIFYRLSYQDIHILCLHFIIRRIRKYTSRTWEGSLPAVSKLLPSKLTPQGFLPPLCRRHVQGSSCREGIDLQLCNILTRATVVQHPDTFRMEHCGLAERISIARPTHLREKSVHIQRLCET